MFIKTYRDIFHSSLPAEFCGLTRWAAVPAFAGPMVWLVTVVTSRPSNDWSASPAESARESCESAQPPGSHSQCDPSRSTTSGTFLKHGN